MSYGKSNLAVVLRRQVGQEEMGTLKKKPYRGSSNHLKPDVIFSPPHRQNVALHPVVTDRNSSSQKNPSFNNCEGYEHAEDTDILIFHKYISA